MLLYFTYNDQPSGVYWSQVTHVLQHFNSQDGSTLSRISSLHYEQTREQA